MAREDRAREDRGETRERKTERGVYFPEQKDGKTRFGKTRLLGGPRAPDEILHVSLNGKVVPGPGFGNKSVMCRHFALAYVQADGNKPGNLFEDFSSVEGVRKVFEEKLHAAEADFHEFTEGADSASIQLMGGKQLGTYMERLAEKLRDGAGSNVDGERSEVRSLLCSMNHAMGLQVQRKYSEERGESFVARVYDPNLTGNAPRLVVLEPKELERFSLHDMLMVAESAKLFESNPRSVYLDKECPVVAICADPSISETIKRLDPPVSKESVFMSMHYGSSLDFEIMSKSGGSGAGERFIDLMSSTLSIEDTDGPPKVLTGLGSALKGSHVSVIELYVDQVLRSGKSSADMTGMLQSRSGNGRLTALDRAIASNDPGAARTFIKALQKVLPAKGVDMHGVLGNFSLEAGLRTGSGEAVNQLIETIRQVPGHVLGDDSKKEMLKEPGLRNAIYSANGEEVENILRTMDASSALTDDEKAELYSRSGFEEALRRGDHEWVSTVYSMTRRTGNLSRENEGKFLSLGLPSLLRERNLDMVDTIVETLSSSSIPFNESNHLLMTQSGLDSALMEGNCKAVLQIVGSIDACRRLDDDQKEFMKSAWNLGTVFERYGEEAVWEVHDTTRSDELEGLDPQLRERWRYSVTGGI